MNECWWALLSAVIVGPLCLAAGLWLSRRTWHTAKRLSARARGHDHLVELGQVVGGLAHEIKNPLSTINLNLTLLAEDIERHDNDVHRRWLRRLRSVQNEAGRLKEIMDDFLRFAGKMELTLQTVDLREVVEELTDFFSPQTEAAGIILRTDLPAEPVRCRLDVGLFKQAVLNLMINGLQAMSRGGELLIRVATNRHRAIVEVIDTGKGIRPEERAKIFKVYYSTKEHGTGLGLPMTRRIIQEHDGTIRVESEPGRGTRFIIALPLNA